LQFTEFVTEIKDMMDKGIDSAMKKHLRKKGAILMVSPSVGVLWGSVGNQGSMGFCGQFYGVLWAVLWGSVGFCGQFYGVLWAVLWGSVGFCGVLWAVFSGD
jgi:hypothetical protein